MVAAMPLPTQHATDARRAATKRELPPAPCPPACGRGTPLTAFASAQRSALFPEQQAPENPGDPRDYESFWYAPLRVAGVSAQRLDAYGVHMCVRPDERKPHPAQSPRLYWRYPVWEEDGLPLTWRLAAVDGEHPRSDWDGKAHPELIYEPLSILPGRPLVICGDVLGVWVLSSLQLPTCTFLCGPSVAPPERALHQIARERPSSCLVVDNGAPALPRGPRAVACLLRGLGIRAGYARLDWPSPICGPTELTMAHLASREWRTGQSAAEQGARVVSALIRMVAERTT